MAGGRGILKTSDVRLGRPEVRQINRTVEFSIESYAKVEGFERAVGISIINPYGHGARIDIDDYVVAEQVWLFFDRIFGPAKRRGEPSLVDKEGHGHRKKFVVEYRLTREDVQEALKTIGEKLGDEWEEAFRRIWSVKHYKLVD